MENPSFWAILPANVRYSKDISSLEKLLYSEITALHNINNNCKASNGYFGRLFDKGDIWVSKCISNLKKHGFIDIIYINGFDRQIIPLFDKQGGVVEKDKGGCRKRQGGVVEKDNNNNTLTESNMNSSSREKLEIKIDNMSNFGLGDENMNFEEFRSICEKNKTNLQKKFFYKIGDDESWEKHVIDFWSSCEDFGKYPTDHTAIRRFERFLKPHHEKQEDVKNMIIAFRKKNEFKPKIENDEIENKKMLQDLENKKEFENLPEQIKKGYIEKAESILIELIRPKNINDRLFRLQVMGKASRIYKESKK